MVTIWSLLADPKRPEKLILQKLFCAFTSCSREDLRSKMDEEMNADLLKKMIDAYDMYALHKKPLEYLLGYAEFFWNKFIVSEATLIPRPETEYMINSVTEFISSKPKAQGSKPENNLLLDIGTGCGVLGISVLLQNPDYFSEVIFSDYYENALEVAKRNFQWLVTSYEWRVEFLHSDLLDFLVNKSSDSPALATSFIKEEFSWNIVLVANLPYIPEETFEANVADNVKKREPKPAFVWWDDGLDYYRIMLDQIITLVEGRKHKVENNGEPSTFHLLPVTMFLEMMTWQVDVLRQEFDQYFVFEEVKTFHFNIRIVKAWLK
jgi:release factor glutamine methyltransferase